MNRLVEVSYNNNIYQIALPHTYPQLKKVLSSLINSSSPYTIYFVNQFMSKTPINNSKIFKRFLMTSTCCSIELLDYSDTDFPAPVKSSKLKKKKAAQMDLEQIPEEDMCTICYDRYENPMSAKCGHRFCLKCWEKTLSNYLECPLCKIRVRLTQLVPYSK